jgi:PIN domain nuclease of toxin-antitoxin system
MSEPSLVLDTHVWIWTVNGDDEIQPALREKIAVALRQASVLVPSICVWEVGMLAKRSRIQLSKPLSIWIQEALDLSGFCLAPLCDAVALEAANLPGEFHSDPADCMIIATARINSAVLLTRDRRILEYGKSGYVNVLEA